MVSRFSTVSKEQGNNPPITLPAADLCAAAVTEKNSNHAAAWGRIPFVDELTD